MPRSACAKLCLCLVKCLDYLCPIYSTKRLSINICQVHYPQVLVYNSAFVVSLECLIPVAPDSALRPPFNQDCLICSLFLFPSSSCIHLFSPASFLICKLLDSNHFYFACGQCLLEQESFEVSDGSKEKLMLFEAP